jgi:hypothetical protein
MPSPTGNRTCIFENLKDIKEDTNLWMERHTPHTPLMVFQEPYTAFFLHGEGHMDSLLFLVPLPKHTSCDTRSHRENVNKVF